MSCGTHGNMMNMANSQQISNKHCLNAKTNVMIQDSQDCPLCFHPNVFNEWASYRDAFVSLTTRNFDCPICHSTIQGLDKFTLHLVSHDLQAKVWGPSSSASLCSNQVTKAFATQSSPHSDTTQLNKNHSNLYNGLTDTTSVSSTNNQSSSMNGINLVNGVPETTCFKSSNYSQLSDTTFHEVIKEEDISDQNNSPSINIPDDSIDEHTGTSRYLDELLNDYSEFVQQQEHNKKPILNHGSRKRISNKMETNYCLSNPYGKISNDVSKVFLAKSKTCISYRNTQKNLIS